VPLSEQFYDSLSEQNHPSLKLTFELLKVIVEGCGKELFHKEFFLWDPLAIQIKRKPELAKMEKIFIKIVLATGQTLQADDNDPEAFAINAAMGLTLEPAQVLIDLIKQIGSYKFKVDRTASHISSFRPAPQSTSSMPIVTVTEERRFTMP
jgi:inosine-uridine nucleoside N-ribohydrolase